MLDSVQATAWKSIDVGFLAQFVELKLKLSLSTKYSWNFDVLMGCKQHSKKKKKNFTTQFINILSVNLITSHAVDLENITT